MIRMIREARITRHCPKCGQRLVVRASPDTLDKVLACPDWIFCKFSEPIPYDILLREMGYPELF